MTQREKIEEIIQQMLLDYTSWVNGEPVAWNVKKAEAITQIETLITEGKIEELQRLWEQREGPGGLRLINLGVGEYIATRQSNLQASLKGK